MNQTSKCLDPHQNKGRGWYRETNLSPPKRFLLTVPRRYFFCGYFFCVCLYYGVLSVYSSLVVTCLEIADLLALLYVMFSCVFFSLSQTVFWIRCGTWLYRFLIFAFFVNLTLTRQYVFPKVSSAFRSAEYIEVHFRLLLIMETITINPSQTAPSGTVWSGPILIAIKATQEHKQTRYQTTKGQKRVKVE